MAQRATAAASSLAHMRWDRHSVRLCAATVAIVATMWMLAACGEDPATPAEEPEDPAAVVAGSQAASLTDVVASQQQVTLDAPAPEGGNASDEAVEIDPLSIPGEIVTEDSLELGECFNQVRGLTSGRRFEIIARIDCEQPHWAEVFHVFEIDVPHPGIHPGDAEMRDYARRSCYEHFEPFVGESYELSVYEIDVFTPTRVNFEHDVARYRTVHCWLHDIDSETISGSAANTRR